MNDRQLMDYDEMKTVRWNILIDSELEECNVINLCDDKKKDR
jgi:hypothetical protein